MPVCKQIGSNWFKNEITGKHIYIYLNVFGLVWSLCLMAYQLFLGYLMPKPFSEKNSSDTI